MTDLPPIREPGRPPAPAPNFQLAVHEDLLPGETEVERVTIASYSGYRGIEYNATGLGDRIDEIVHALDEANMQAASVHLGAAHDFLHPDEPTREQALNALREAIAHAVDIGAGTVTFIPQPAPALALPNLMPYKAPIQLAVELMTWHLRAYSDLAYVFGVDLCLHPVGPQYSAFLNRLAQGEELRRRIKFHEHVWLAADTYHMAHAEQDALAALAEHGDAVRLVYFGGTGDRLPNVENEDEDVPFINAIPPGVRWGVVRSPKPHGPQSASELARVSMYLEMIIEGLL